MTDIVRTAAQSRECEGEGVMENSPLTDTETQGTNNILNLVNFSILLFQFLGAIVNLLISSDLLERNRDPDCFTKNAR